MMTSENNGNGRISIRDLDVRLRKVETRIAEQHGYTRTLTCVLQLSVAFNVAIISGALGYFFRNLALA